METTKWPDNWHKLSCPNGHEIKSYSYTAWTPHPIRRGECLRIYGICDVCGVQWAFIADVAPTLDVAIPERVMLPSADYDKPLDLPPFKLPDED